jgi:serine/threonine protein kinase
VDLADQLSVGRKVALKVLHGECTTDEEFVSRFRQEARLAASLSNRNVVTVYDFDQTDDGRLFIAMEYVDGRTLSDVIKQDGALSLRRVVRLATRIATGLHLARRA